MKNRLGLSSTFKPILLYNTESSSEETKTALFMHEWEPTYCWREEKDFQKQTYAKVKHFTGDTSAQYLESSKH